MATGIEVNMSSRSSQGQDEPSSTSEDASWVDAMDKEDLWIGDMIAVESVASAGSVLLINIDGVVHAYDNRCPHRGGRLSDGEFADGIVVCPIHRWEFCAHSGRGVNPTGAQLVQHSVRIEGDRILILLRRT